ncbi:MAG: transporter [Rhodobacteraceae bacterium]|nr:transporter [Paracoccaceae bacterium]
MIDAFLVVLPIFGLIFAGWIAGRRGVLGAQATPELNRFVIWLAIPAMLFGAAAEADAQALWQPALVVSYAVAGMVTMAIAMLVARARRVPLADAALDGLNASYPNVGFMGFPIALTAMGPEAMVPTTICALLTMCVIFAVSIVFIETGLQEDQKPWPLIRNVALQIIRNPLIVAPLAGALFPVLGLGLPGPAARFLDLLGGAAAPCALVIIGLFLANNPVRIDRNRLGRVAFLIVLKLGLQPLVALGLALWLGLGSLGTAVVVVMAALPTGTGAFMLAEYYDRQTQESAEVIILSTLVSVITVSLCIGLLA